MATLPLVLVKTEQEYSNQKIVLEKRLGQGAFGLTFLTSLGGEKRVVKFLTSSKEDKGEDVLKEAIIGFELKQRLPEHIKVYFTGVFRLIICKDISIPKEVIDSIQNDDSLLEKFQKATEFYIIEQEYISNATTGMDWLASQNNVVSEDIIRSIMFQLVISLCYAQTILGFQHNDLKLENLMFIPNKTSLPLYIPYQFPDGDIFELVIPVGGVQVRIIDLGASSLYGRDINKQPSYINAKTAHTLGYIPFEYNLYPDYNLEGRILEQRMNDADIPGLFKIMLNLTAHNKNGWKYNVGSDGTGTDYSDLTTTSDVIDKLKALFSKTLFTPKSKEMTDTEYEEDKQWRVVSVLAETLILTSLGITLENYNDEEYFSLSSLGDTVRKQILKNYTILLSKEFKNIAKTVEKFDAIRSILDSDIGLHFIRALARPFSYNRQSFGLPKPFDKYSLANALYHPFFAYHYWKTNTSHPLSKISVGIDAPLIFLGKDADDAKLAPSKFAKAYLKDFENLKASTTGKDDSEVTPPSSVKPSGGGKKKTTSTVQQGGSPPVEWTDQFVADLTTASARLLRDVDILNAPKDVVDSLSSSPPVLKALIKVLEPNREDKDIPSGTGSGVKLATLLWQIIEGKKGAKPSKIETPPASPAKKSAKTASTTTTTTTTTTPGSGFKKWTQDDLNKLGEKDGVPVTSYTLQEYAGMTDAQLDALNVQGNEQLLQNIAKHLNIPLTEKEKTKPKIIEKLKELFALTRGEKVPKKAKSSILEAIEHHPSFIIPEADNVFDTVSISEELYIPLREAVLQHPELTKVATHLGIDKPLFEYPLVDMTKRSNQIRYLHTLSVLAEMIESKVITQDKIERCFVEWPPTPQYRMGEINEI